jgi:long-chain acyl-CoA synthetase
VFLVINPQTKHDKLCFIANDCAIRHLVTDIHLANVAGAVVGAVPSLTHILVSGSGESLDGLSGPGVTAEWLDKVLAGPIPEMRPPGTIPSDLASLIYTSGSTGNPKGVMQTHQSMAFAVGSLTEYQRLDEDDVLINMLPMAFDYGLYQLLMSVATGATLVLERSFTYPAEVFARMLQHGVTHFPGVPTIYTMMIAAHRRKSLEFPTVRRVTNTAAALHPALFPTLREIFPECTAVRDVRADRVQAGQLPAARAGGRQARLGRHRHSRHRGLPALARGPARAPGEPGILHVRGRTSCAATGTTRNAPQKCCAPATSPANRYCAPATGSAWMRTAACIS